ncbi:MAG: DUF58 domain-containing protein [Gemmatimonadaceae bacterium]
MSRISHAPDTPVSGSARPTLADVLHRVRLLDLRSRHVITETLAGEYSSAFRGRGVDFADVREYTPGDDVRTIDWRVTARSGAVFVRRYVEERELTVLFLIDLSASEGFGSRVRTKSELAAELSAVLAMTAVRNNDRVGAVLFTDRVEHFLPPRKGRRHALRFLRELLSFQPSSRRTDLRPALAFANRVLRRRAVVFIISDWMATGHERELAATARLHDTIAAQLVDPRERELPNVGLMTLRDPENGSWRVIDTSDRAVREQLQRRATEFDLALERSLRQQGIDFLHLATNEQYIMPLRSLFRRREHAGRR